MVRQPWFPRVFPFAVYMLFILLHDLVGKTLPPGPLATHLIAVTYPVRILCVVAALVWLWGSYDELRGDRFKPGNLLLSIGVGALVFVLWIHMDWDFAVMGDREAYDPRTLPGGWFYPFVAVRLFGAAMVVPVFEEIFWRSFILRYIVNPDFTSVKTGTFTWPSFLISAILFGTEHNLWLAGVATGLIYNLLLYKTRSLWLCIIAHGVTNLLLGIYVMTTGHWEFW